MDKNSEDFRFTVRVFALVTGLMILAIWATHPWDLGDQTVVTYGDAVAIASFAGFCVGMYCFGDAFLSLLEVN